jgi:hypothetical protein
VRAIVTGDDLDERPSHGRLHQGRAGVRQGQGALRRRDRRRGGRRQRGDRPRGDAPDPRRLRELPAVVDPAAALAPGAALIHEGSASYVKVFDAGTDGNLCSRTDFTSGDVDAAWAECDAVVESTFQTQAQAHLSLEPVGALAEIEAGGRITLWSANQSVFRCRRASASRSACR